MPLDSAETVAAETQEIKPARKSNAGRPLGATKLKFSDEIVKQIEGLARIQCTLKEAGAVLGVCENTLRYFLSAHEKANAAWEHGKETGKASLRRSQFKMAEHNPTMAIWLGKQCLDQTDKSESYVKSDNRHHHSAEPLSPLARHLAEVIGERAEEPPEGPLQN